MANMSRALESILGVATVAEIACPEANVRFVRRQEFLGAGRGWRLLQSILDISHGVVGDAMDDGHVRPQKGAMLCPVLKRY